MFVQPKCNYTFLKCDVFGKLAAESLVLPRMISGRIAFAISFEFCGAEHPMLEKGKIPRTNYIGHPRNVIHTVASDQNIRKIPNSTLQLDLKTCLENNHDIPSNQNEQI